MKTVLSFAIIFFCQVVLAAPKKYTQETEITLSPTSKFKISEGWSFDASSSRLTAPEGDLIAYLLERPFESDLEAFSLRLWKTVNPNFNLKVSQSQKQLAKAGWEQIHELYYETPEKENRFVATEIRVFKGKAYVLLLDAFIPTFAKRESQLLIVSDTWHHTDMKPEDLSQKKVQLFTPAHTAALEEFTSKAMKELGIPGSSVAIVQSGKVVFRQGFGVKQLGKKESVTPQTMFMIGSTTKPLTTLMLSKLVEQGRLTWDTPIKKIILDFALADKAVTEKITVKHTACACTGMPRQDMGMVFEPAGDSLEQLVTKMRSLRPTTGFGETFQYSNQLVGIGGIAGAVAYGSGPDYFARYESAMNNLVFKPLGMSSTRVKPLPQDAQNLASPHAYAFDGSMQAFPQAIDDNVYHEAPAGSVWSNVDDMAKYLMMELKLGKSPDGRVLFSEEQIKLRRKPGIKISESASYGLGLMVDKKKGLTMIGHGGNTFGFTHELIFLPDLDLGIVVQTNAGFAGAFTYSLVQKTLELLLGAQPLSDELVEHTKRKLLETESSFRNRVSTKPEDMKWIGAFAGEYANPELGRITIMKSGTGYVMKTKYWESQIASGLVENGAKQFSLISPPWIGMPDFRVQERPKKSLILDDNQKQYVFTFKAQPKLQ